MGSKEGGRKAAQTMKERFGEDHFKKIGAIGGRNGNTGGFASGKMCNCDLIAGEHKYAMCSGVKGGKISRRGKAKQ